MEIRLLGRLELLSPEPAELPPSKKTRAVLAYLVATERSHDRNFLASLLWDDREDARGALRWSLSRLRPLVDDSKATRLVADRDRVAFERHGAEVDLIAVRSALRDGIDQVPTDTLERAVGWFRGEFLEGLDLTECYGFHAWCIAEREAARALRLSMLSTIVERLGDEPERALPYARAQLDLDPLAGRAQAAVVRLLGALGREREANEMYESFKHMLRTRLGERTSIELERARVALRASPRSTIDVAPASASVPEPRASNAKTPPVLDASSPQLARLARSPFVGRQRELATLVNGLDAAIAGSSTFVELAGEAGIGKSRLVEELTHQAHLRGTRVLKGRCLEGEGTPAYLPFLDSLDVALGDADLERLPGAEVALAARLLPRLAARLGSPAQGSIDATSERYLVFQAVATLLERIAAPAGAVLVIEDVHWIDGPSLALLRYLAGRLDGARLLVVTTYRDEGLGVRHHEALAELRRSGAVRVALGGLTPAETRTFVDALASAVVPPTLFDRLVRETAGHPLFLQEILKSLVEENALASTDVDSLRIPDGVRQVIARRLDRLSERARRLLAVASPMIGAFRWELVREVSSEQEDALLDALEELLAAQLLRESVVGGVASYEFSHALVAQTLYEGLPMPRRIRLHRQIGEVMERIHAQTLEPQLAALAHHFYVAASDDALKAKAIDYAIRAAEHASAQVAFEEAARHYLRAIALVASSDRTRLADLYRRRGRALAIVSAWTEACADFETALSHADPDQPAWRAEVLVELGNASMWARDVPAVAERARAAAELVGSLGRDDLTLAINGMLAQCLASEGQLDEAIARYQHVESSRGERHVPSLALAPLTLYWSGRIDESVAWGTALVAASQRTNDIVATLIGMPPLGMALAASGRYREALAVFAEARAIGHRAHARSFLSRAVSMSTGLHIDLGDLDTAEELATEAAELARLADWTPGEISAAIDQAVCRLRRHDVGAAERIVEEAARKSTAIGGNKPTSGFHNWLWAIRISWLRSEIATARNDHDTVEKLAADTLARAAGRRPKYEVAALVSRAASRAKRGDAKSALADLDRALELARGSRDPALFLRAAVPRCALAGSDQLAAAIAEAQRRVDAR